MGTTYLSEGSTFVGLLVFVRRSSQRRGGGRGEEWSGGNRYLKRTDLTMQQVYCNLNRSISQPTPKKKEGGVRKEGRKGKDPTGHQA